MSTAVIFLLLAFTAVYDIKKLEIPPYIPLLLSAVGTVRIFMHELPLSSSLLGFAVLGGIFLCLAMASGNVGGGDIKLVASLGFALGLYLSYLSVLIAVCLVSLTACVPYMRCKSIAFAPFVLAGYIFTLILK